MERGEQLVGLESQDHQEDPVHPANQDLADLRVVQVGKA